MFSVLMSTDVATTEDQPYELISRELQTRIDVPFQDALRFRVEATGQPVPRSWYREGPTSRGCVDPFDSLRFIRAL